MAAIIIAGLPSSRKTPGVFLNSILGGPGAGSGTAQQRLMLVGNMIESAPSLTAPAATLAAGTATLAVPVQIFNESDAILYFGKGSELHLMVQAALKQDPNTVLWATPLGKGATPTAASMTVTFSGTAPTTDLAIEVLCDGQRLEFAIPSGTTTTGCATLLAQNVLNASDLPITAQFAAGVCTFTAKCPGTRGNRIQVRINVTVGSNTTKLRTWTSLTGTFSGTSITQASRFLTGGLVTESTTLTTVLTALANERWHRIAYAVEDATNAAAATAASTSKAAATSMLWEQCVFANVDDFTAATVGAQAVALALNNARAQLVWQRKADRLPGVLAASMACARLQGDSVIGGTAVGEVEDPACPLDGLQLAAVPVQEYILDKPLATEIETALNYGVTPLQPSFARPGYAEAVRSVTTRYLDQTGSQNYAVLDTTECTVTDHVADRIRREVQVKFARTKLADDDARGRPVKTQGIVTPNILRSFIASILTDEEDLGHIINVAAHMDKLQVLRNTAARGRADAEIPVEPAPAFHIFGGNVRQQVL